MSHVNWIWSRTQKTCSSCSKVANLLHDSCSFSFSNQHFLMFTKREKPLIKSATWPSHASRLWNRTQSIQWRVSDIDRHEVFEITVMAHNRESWRIEYSLTHSSVMGAFRQWHHKTIRISCGFFCVRLPSSMVSNNIHSFIGARTTFHLLMNYEDLSKSSETKVENKAAWKIVRR